MNYNVGRTAYLTFIQNSLGAKLLAAAYQQAAAIRQVTAWEILSLLFSMDYIGAH